MSSLDLGADRQLERRRAAQRAGEIVWACLPRFDGDAGVLLAAARAPAAEQDFGFFEVDLADFERSEQAYIAHTPMLVTRLYDGTAAASRDHRFRAALPAVRPAVLPGHAGAQGPAARGQPAHPRMRMRPACDYGARAPPTTWGSNHVRYVMPDYGPAADDRFLDHRDPRGDAVRAARAVSLVLGPDETLQGSAGGGAPAVPRDRPPTGGATGCAASPSRSNGRSRSSAPRSRSSSTPTRTPARSSPR